MIPALIFKLSDRFCRMGIYLKISENDPGEKEILQRKRIKWQKIESRGQREGRWNCLIMSGGRGDRVGRIESKFVCVVFRR